MCGHLPPCHLRAFTTMFLFQRDSNIYIYVKSAIHQKIYECVTSSGLPMKDVESGPLKGISGCESGDIFKKHYL